MTDSEEKKDKKSLSDFLKDLSSRKKLDFENYDANKVKFVHGNASTVAKLYKELLELDPEENLIVLTPLNEERQELDVVIKKLLGITQEEASITMNIHQSQGAEWSTVILYLPKVFDLKLIQVGCTRAKDRLIIVGNEEIFVNSVNKS